MSSECSKYVIYSETQRKGKGEGWYSWTGYTNAHVSPRLLGVTHRDVSLAWSARIPCLVY